MKNFKKIISVLLALVMLTTSLVVTSTAAEADLSSAYVADYDTETPVIIVHGMSQNNTYLLDENGEWAKNGDKYITGWPLNIDIGALLKTALPSLLASIIFRRDCGISDAIYNAAFEALSVIVKDKDGNYVNNIEVPCYECPMSELPAEVKEEYYKFLPIQELGQIVGEDKVYYFGYDSLGDVIYETDKLNKYIHEVVIPQTGSDKIKICAISQGGTIAVNYLDTYPEDYNIIEKMVFVVPAIDGSDIIGDLLTKNLSVFYSDEDLYQNLLVNLLGETPLAYILNIVLRILPEDVLKATLNGLLEGLIDVAVRPNSMIWALCPTEYYPKAREMWLTDDYATIRTQVDRFMKSRANFEKNLYTLMDTGCKAYDVACYDVNLFPLCKNYKTKNADRVIHAASPSMGATFADLGTTLGENYVAKGTYCNNPEHNHLSPDGVVDATTGLLPCTTWYFKGQAHEQLPNNDVALKLSIRIMTDNNMIDVYSNPDAYPQFNNSRLTNTVKEYMEAWEEADKTFIPYNKGKAVENAIEDVNALLEETVIDTEKWENAEKALGNALYAAGVISNPNPTIFDKFFTLSAKTANQCVNKVYDTFDK